MRKQMLFHRNIGNLLYNCKGRSMWLKFRVNIIHPYFQETLVYSYYQDVEVSTDVERNDVQRKLQCFNTWFGSLNPALKCANCGWMALRRISDEFGMLGITDWISPGCWDGCNNGGKFIDISRGNPSPDEGPGRWWTDRMFIKATSGMFTEHKLFFSIWYAYID